MFDLLAFAGDCDIVSFLPEMALCLDDALDAGDLFLLEVEFLLQGFARFRLLTGERFVIARVEGSFCIFDVKNFRGDAIQKIAVMGHDDQRFRIGTEMIFEPKKRVCVKMIRRFVENEQVWLDEEQTHEREARAFAAGQRADALGLLRFRKAEACQHGADTGFIFIAADFAEFLRQRGEFRDHAVIFFVVRFRGTTLDLLGKHSEARFGAATIGERVRHLVKDRPIAFKHGILFEHAYGFAL